MFYFFTQRDAPLLPEVFHFIFHSSMKYKITLIKTIHNETMSFQKKYEVCAYLAGSTNHTPFGVVPMAHQNRSSYERNLQFI